MKKMIDKPGRILLAFLTIIMVSLISLQVILLRNESALVETSSTQVDEALPTPTIMIEPTETTTPLVVKEDDSVTNTIEQATVTPSTTDFRLGYIDRGQNCFLMSEITALALERQFSLKVELIEYDALDELFMQLTSTTDNEIDLTLCFLDPVDRSYISKYFGFMKQLGGAYWQNESDRLLIMADASILVPLQKDQPCVYRFFRKIKFESDEFKETIDASTWIQNNRAKVRGWTACDIN